MRVAIVAFVLFVGALGLVPQGAAQSTSSVSVAVDVGDLGGDGRLHPETEQATGAIMAQVVFAPITFCAQPVDVFFKVRSSPTYSSVLIENPKQLLSVPPSATPTSHTVKTSFVVSTTRDAPAFEDAVYSFAVEVLAPPMSSGCNLTSSQGVGTATIKNDYVPGLKIGDPVLTQDGMSGTVLVPLANLGNGPTRIIPELVPEQPVFVLLSAAEVTLGAAGSESSQGVLEISYVLDGVEKAAFHAILTSSHDAFPSDYEQAEMVLVATGTMAGETSELHGDDVKIDPAADLPGPGLSLIVLLVGAIAGLLRRRVLG